MTTETRINTEIGEDEEFGENSYGKLWKGREDSTQRERRPEVKETSLKVRK